MLLFKCMFDSSMGLKEEALMTLLFSLFFFFSDQLGHVKSTEDSLQYLAVQISSTIPPQTSDSSKH